MSSLSILTVAKNSNWSLLGTFASLAPLLRNLSDQIEWIIVDGSSTDVSIECLQLIASSALHNIRIYSEPDSGIYNAMNKALFLSSGKFVIFLNSGDVLVEATAAEFVNKLPVLPAIYTYSYLIRDYNSGKVYEQCMLKVYLQVMLSFLNLNLPTSHNSIIYPSPLIKGLPFKEHYLCAADFEQYIAAKIRGVKVVYRHSKALSAIDINGYISSRKGISFREYCSVSDCYTNLLASLYWRLRLFFLKK